MFCKTLMFYGTSLIGVKPNLYTDSYDVAMQTRDNLNKTLTRL